MKTITKPIVWLLFCCAMLLNLTTFAQYPVLNAPIWKTVNGVYGISAPVGNGNLDNMDKGIWFKVNGNMAGPTPHNKMHPFVTAGSAVDANFNVNKIPNRYTLVSYTVAADGTRNIYDYQSNLYNTTGSSFQQLVLVPTCKFEVYMIKGTLITSFSGPITTSATDAPTAGPTGNPYNLPGGNRIIDYAFGGSGECNSCPAIVNPGSCVYTKLLEVIDIPATSQKELIFSVINNTGTSATNCGNYDFLGDVAFTNITPTQTTNNTPYSFRYDAQLGTVIPNYPLPGAQPPANYPGGAFVFDQRNNHNGLAYDTYQSEIFRFKVSNAEYARLTGTPAPTPAPQICVELSSKHPEPGNTLIPIYCAEISFGPCNGGVEPCFEATSTSGNIVAQIPNEFTSSGGFFDVPVKIFNFSSSAVTNISLTTGPTPVPILAPGTGAYSGTNFSYNAVNDNTSNVTLTGTNTTTFNNGASDLITLHINAQDFLNAGAVITVSVTTANGTTETFDLETGDCGIIGPLPVKLLNFTGTKTSKGVDLKWKTATEKDNDRFEIERSADGRSFEQIGSVKGNGTSNSTNSYAYLDATPGSEVNYYRLKQVDFDGKSEYSNIVTVKNSSLADQLVVSIIPNPCHDQNCSVQLKGTDTSKNVTIMLQDLTGRVVFQKVVPGNETSIQLPKIDSGKGIYILSATNGNYTAFQKIVLQ